MTLNKEKMLKQNIKINTMGSDNTFLFAMILFAVAIYFFIIMQWDWTLMLSVFAGCMLVFFYWNRKRHKPLHDVVVMLCIISSFLASSYLAGFVSESMNKRVEQQSICGEISTLTASTGREMARFQLRSAHKSMTFLQVDERPDLMQLHKKLCVQYSIHPKWSRYPYIHVMIEQK